MLNEIQKLLRPAADDRIFEELFYKDGITCRCRANLQTRQSCVKSMGRFSERSLAFTCLIQISDIQNSSSHNSTLSYV